MLKECPWCGAGNDGRECRECGETLVTSRMPSHFWFQIADVNMDGRLWQMYGNGQMKNAKLGWIG